jgi:hypothetical protein
LQRASAFLDEPAEGAIDQIFGILFAEKIDLAFEAKLEQGGCHRYSVGGVRRLLDPLRELALDRVRVGLRAFLEGCEFPVEILAGAESLLLGVLDLPSHG